MMGKATMLGGDLIDILDCYINIGGNGPMYQYILPEISDTKSASYPEEPLMGRATPLKNYSYSETRNISWTMHFMILKDGDADDNLTALRTIESAVYPLDNVGTAPYAPPYICQIQCGKLLGDKPLCAIMKSYSVKFPTDVAWDETTLVPYKFDVDMTFEVVYDSTDLPGASRILASGL
jgi:hypothetical protein